MEDNTDSKDNGDIKGITAQNILEEKVKEKPAIEVKKEKVPFTKKIYNLYDKEYKKLLIIPFLILAFAVIVLGFKYATTGEFVEKGVTLKGGLTITILTTEKVDTGALQNGLLSKFPKADVDVRVLTSAGKQTGVTVSASDVDEGSLIAALEETFGKFREGDYAFETTGSSLGMSFFRETIKAVIISFLFTGVVVFIYFSENTLSKVLIFILAVTASALIFYSQTLVLYLLSSLLIAVLIYIYFKFSIPSIAVMLAALSTMITTLATINLLGIKLSTAGVAGFLMLIGYSVDTDILLSVRVLKIKSGSILERTLGAMKTGITMNFAAMAAVLVAYVITESTILKQIMLILFIGLVFDIVFTWIQNAGILRLYLEKKGARSD